MPHRRTLRSLLAAAVLAATTAAVPGCRDAAPTPPAPAVDAYLGRWIVVDPMVAALPLGLQLSQSAAGLQGWASYSGFAYPVVGRVEGAELVLQSSDASFGAVTHLRGTLRPDGLLALRLTPPTGAPMDFLLRKD